jgi:hypothetical protein
VETLQLILALPLLVIVLFAAFQYGVLMLVQQAVTHAATAGAREAGKGVHTNTVEAVVNEVLSPHNLMTGPGVLLTVERPGPLVETRGGPVSCTPTMGAPLGPNDVRVTLNVDLTQAPMLNVLKVFDANLDLTGKCFQISAVSPVE